MNMKITLLNCKRLTWNTYSKTSLSQSILFVSDDNVYYVNRKKSEATTNQPTVLVTLACVNNYYNIINMRSTWRDSILRRIRLVLLTTPKGCSCIATTKTT